MMRNVTIIPNVEDGPAQGITYRTQDVTSPLYQKTSSGQWEWGRTQEENQGGERPEVRMLRDSDLTGQIDNGFRSGVVIDTG